VAACPGVARLSRRGLDQGRVAWRLSVPGCFVYYRSLFCRVVFVGLLRDILLKSIIYIIHYSVVSVYAADSIPLLLLLGLLLAIILTPIQFHE